MAYDWIVCHYRQLEMNARLYMVYMADDVIIQRRRKAIVVFAASVKFLIGNK